MSNASAAFRVKNSAGTNRRPLFRAAVVALGALGMIAASIQPAAAQTLAPTASTWEFRVSSGAFVPAGEQRNALKDANVSAAQLSWLVRPSLAVTGTFGWARSRDVASINVPRLDVFTSDLGIEARPSQWFAGHAVTFSPFVGLGGGARSYNYRTLDVNATNNLAGYGSVGGELGFKRVGVRLEARDYATGFKPLLGGGTSDVRNDVVIMAAVRFNRRASQH